MTFTSPADAFRTRRSRGTPCLVRDLLAYCDFDTDRHQRANDIVRKRHALTVFRVNRPNFALGDALRPAPKFAVGGWAWVYNSTSNIYQGVKANTDAMVLKAKTCASLDGPVQGPSNWSLLLYLDRRRLAAR